MFRKNDLIPEAKRKNRILEICRKHFADTDSAGQFIIKIILDCNN